MNATQMIDKLDRAALTISAPDGRAILQREANELRAHVQRAQRAASLRAALDKLAGDHSNQASAQRAELQRSLSANGPVDLAGRIAEAARALDLWA